MLFYVVEIFVNSLLYFQQTFSVLKALKNLDAIAPAILSIGSWAVKTLIWQTLLTRQCEKFYISMENVRDSCLNVLKSNCSDEKKKLCKNVLRLHRASFSKIRACGLFYVDAALQLALMGLLTNYTIILLQFALL
ncbi:uncharacterized protein LOC124641558 [Helicoverpa zea]|uniref:uncharacterized protein LOC124641558 n=1 Tax=Helicoverpa zea TaxID=7113 RepID=UPI001F586B39|nr:uncharacterized protein LOC124641558 [Helicoverpa zea]